MKRFLTLGLSAFLLTTILVPIAHANEVSNEVSNVSERSPQTTETTQQQAVKKQAVTVAKMPDTNQENALTERDRIVLQYRLQEIIPRQD